MFDKNYILNVLKELKAWAEDQIGQGCSDHNALAKDMVKRIQEEINAIALTEQIEYRSNNE